MGLEGMLTIRGSFPASGDLSADQYKLVVFDATPELALAGAGAGGFVLVDKPDAQGVNGTVILAGKAKVTAGGAVSAGDPVTSDASGLAVTAAPGAGSNVTLAGYALEDAASGDVFQILVAPSVMQG